MTDKATVLTAERPSDDQFDRDFTAGCRAPDWGELSCTAAIEELHAEATRARAGEAALLAALEAAQAGQAKAEEECDALRARVAELEGALATARDDALAAAAGEVASYATQAKAEDAEMLGQGLIPSPIGSAEIARQIERRILALKAAAPPEQAPAHPVLAVADRSGSSDSDHDEPVAWRTDKVRLSPGPPRTDDAALRDRMIRLETVLRAGAELAAARADDAKPASHDLAGRMGGEWLLSWSRMLTAWSVGAMKLLGEVPPERPASGAQPSVQGLVDALLDIRGWSAPRTPPNWATTPIPCEDLRARIHERTWAALPGEPSVLCSVAPRTDDRAQTPHPLLLVEGATSDAGPDSAADAKRPDEGARAQALHEAIAVVQALREPYNSQAHAVEALEGLVCAGAATNAPAHRLGRCPCSECDSERAAGPDGPAAADVGAAPADPVQRILEDVRAERARQDAKWGTDRIATLPDGTGRSGDLETADYARRRCDAARERGVVTYRHVLAEEVAEALAETDPALLRAELVQVAAVAVKWIQGIDMRTASPAPSLFLKTAPASLSRLATSAAPRSDAQVASDVCTCSVKDPFGSHETACVSYSDFAHQDDAQDKEGDR